VSTAGRGGFGDRQHLVWAYGSLMSSTSLASTLEGDGVVEPLTVRGLRRAWNCVSFLTFQHEQRTVRRAVLGVTFDLNATSEGLLLKVDAEAMVRLRAREGRYREVDISEHVAGLGGVVTFVPHHSQTRGSAPVAEPLVIQQEYLELCVGGAEEHGLRAAPEEIRAAVDLEVVPNRGTARPQPY
jgi:hypothetical protein